MSVSDPLIKELKGCTIKLVQDCESTNGHVSDENLNLQQFCQLIEKIFQKGLAVRTSFGLSNDYPESWSWLEYVGRLMEEKHIDNSFKYGRALDLVRQCQKITTSLGRLRLLIRYCLVDKCLHVPVEIFVRHLKHIQTSYYKPSSSILAHEILGEIFLSVLYQISRINFHLNVNNSRFLDSSWLLPDFLSYEFVPCNNLGITINFVQNKAIVINVQSNSVASEDDKIEIGDVLDELNGHVVNLSMRGKLGTIMERSRNRPVTVKVIKAHYFKCGDLYSPLVHLLRKAKIDPDVLRRRYQIVETEEDVKRIDSCKTSRAGVKVSYIGKVAVGTEGDVKKIATAMSQLLNEATHEIHVILFECQELGVRVTDASTGDVILTHAYMNISSCGQSSKYPNYFAYIAGEDVCNLSHEFICYIFHSSSDRDIEVTLQSIAQGFQRTHFAV